MSSQVVSHGGISFTRWSEMTAQRVDGSRCCHGRRGLYIPSRGRSSSGWKDDSAGQRLKEVSQEPCNQPQTSAGWWSLDFLQSTRVRQSWMVLDRDTMPSFCATVDLSVPICKREVGLGPQIHANSVFPCFPLISWWNSELFLLPGREKKAMDWSSLYSGSNLGPNCSNSPE